MKNQETQKINQKNLRKWFIRSFAIFTLVPLLVRMYLDAQLSTGNQLSWMSWWNSGAALTQQEANLIMWFWSDLFGSINTALIGIYFLVTSKGWAIFGVVILGSLGISTVFSDYEYLGRFDNFFVPAQLGVALIILFIRGDQKW